MSAPAFEPDRLPPLGSRADRAAGGALDLCEVARELEALAVALAPEQRAVIDRAQRLLSRQGAALTQIAVTLRQSGTTGALI